MVNGEMVFGAVKHYLFLEPDAGLILFIVISAMLVVWKLG
jgi:hypothetical protein